ncbi:unnamed protein product [Discula destructiva]
MDTPAMSTQELQLCQFLMELPAQKKYRYTKDAEDVLLQTLFLFMAGGKDEYLRLFFPNGGPVINGQVLRLKDAQGAVEGSEYTEAARGKACGHIFKAGEASYGCKTCGVDDTCCLCAKCFDATDHTGHMVRISISPGNSGCCDCGDAEAWKTPVFCTIHSMWEHEQAKGKARAPPLLPDELIASTRMTIGRVIDYLCDVISCSPEQLRQSKTAESIQQDEKSSRLNSVYHGGDVEPASEFAIILWNDEKHTVQEVKDQVARACNITTKAAMQNAYETDLIGRSILTYSEDVGNLLYRASVLEQIRVTVTIRSSRDTFREQMCGTIIEWLKDIAGCSVGDDHSVLRTIVCEEMLKPWRMGSPATHAIVGQDGIDDEELEPQEPTVSYAIAQIAGIGPTAVAQARAMLDRVNRQANRMAMVEDDDDDENDDDDSDVGLDEHTPDSSHADSDGDEDGDDGHGDGDGGDDGAEDEEEDVQMLDAGLEASGDAAMSDWRADEALEEAEATMAGYPAPPPPPAPSAARRAIGDREMTPSDSDTADPPIYANKTLDVPKTPGSTQKDATPHKSGRYWLLAPDAYLNPGDVSPAEDVFQRVRLDWMILFDLRMWKKVRNDLRSLYISTVVTIPEFKRVLGLRFAGLYTTLAQLYLIADREPDHSIINLSLQMLTTASITAEVVERGNFLTSLIAILYTFLTTRQVAYPWNVSDSAVLAFDTGSVTNRRMYHFFTDLKYLFLSTHVQERLRAEEKYMMQFLDLVKLHQGICPNTRAIGEHVEYETDTWISASLITREINRLCRLFSRAFETAEPAHFEWAIRLAAKTVIFNSIGGERNRFSQAEIKDEVRFKTLTDFEFDPGSKYEVVKFVVEEQPISFHHALHYTLSWLIECGKSMSVEQLRTMLSFTDHDLKGQPRLMGKKSPLKRKYAPEDYLMAAFDFPLRVCAWLSQMKAGMWVRNGMSLRHQSGTYRGVSQRDVSHHRDIFLLQTAFVVCNPGRVLASVVDRFGMEMWVKGIFEKKSTDQDDAQHLDVAEDMIHLLVVLLSDRTSLTRSANEPNSRLRAMRRDLVHVLCFKPLSFTDIGNKLPERYQDQEDFTHVLASVSNYKAPEGMTDVGTFELKPECVEEIDPYIAHYSKNQREEAETAWRTFMAKKTGKPIEEMVYEPKLRPIERGVFENLAGVTSSGMFAQVVYYSLLYALGCPKWTPSIPSGRLEAYLQVVLHLILIAVVEDQVSEADTSQDSFIFTALTKTSMGSFLKDYPTAKTIVSVLELLSAKEDLKVCHPRITLILRRMRQKRPQEFEAAYVRLGVPVDRISTASPAVNAMAEQERERKKQAALDRQAKVMAQFQQQQKSFMANQSDLDWGIVDDLEDEDLPEPVEEKVTCKYPSGSCILCQGGTDTHQLYGTFALISESGIFRQTDLSDPDFVREVCNVPKDLDRSAEAVRPFGVAHENRIQVEKVNQKGETFSTERQVIGKGWPRHAVRNGPVSTGCGHIMHYKCFEDYFEAAQTRHRTQIARHQPENLKRMEFVCPLCKALGNAFLPIIWKGVEESYPSVLVTSTDVQVTSEAFAVFLKENLTVDLDARAERSPNQALEIFAHYTKGSFLPTFADRSAQLRMDAWSPSSGSDTPRAEPHLPMAELVQSYRRIRDTIKKSDLIGPHGKAAASYNEGRMMPAGLSDADVLAQAVGFSITAAEIQQRGLDAEYGSLLLENIPESTLTHLRILAETVTSYIAVGGQKYNGNKWDFVMMSTRQHKQLFVPGPQSPGVRNEHPPGYPIPSLLSSDPFVFLCESIFGVAASHGFDISFLLRLCYLAEIVKVVYRICRAKSGTEWMTYEGTDRNLTSFSEFCRTIYKMNEDFPSADDDERLAAADGENGPTTTSSSGSSGGGFNQPCFASIADYYAFTKKYAQCFLRKSVILLYVKYGVDFNSHISPAPQAEELDRLTEALRLPDFDSMCAALTPLGIHVGWPGSLCDQLVRGWVRHDKGARWHSNTTMTTTGTANRFVDTQQFPRASAPETLLAHPGIFELVGLPRNFDTLIEECTKRRCPKTGKDVSDPIICLLCGEVFCGQSICCTVEDESVRSRGGGGGGKIGGAQQHMRKCQGSMGIFILIRKCAVFYLHRLSGSFSLAPYIDTYGETDMGLRHSRQLFLSQKRYDSMLRTMWLAHGVPSYIARRLEADINTGGWETI